MENSPNYTQPPIMQNPSSSALISTPVSQPAAPAQPQATSAQTTHHSSRILILIASLVIAIALVAVGFIFRFSPITGARDRTIEDIAAEIATLDPQIAELSAAESATFATTGFSEAYFAAADATAELKAERADLEAELENLSAIDASRTIFTTGAIWFLLAAAIVLIVGITVFLHL